MKKGYKKNQIVVVTKSINGNLKGTITKILVNKNIPIKFYQHVDSIVCEAITGLIIMDPTVSLFINGRTQLCCEEIYIRPATTHEKRARRKGIYLPKKRKDFNDLQLGDTLMMQYNQHFIEVKIDALHFIHTDKGIKMLDIGVKPVNLKKEFKGINDFLFLNENQIIMGSAPPVY